MPRYQGNGPHDAHDLWQPHKDKRERHEVLAPEAFVTKKMEILGWMLVVRIYYKLRTKTCYWTTPEHLASQRQGLKGTL